MGKTKIVTQTNLLSTGQMLSELCIGIHQLRIYINDGRLKARKIRNRFFATREDFDAFKEACGF